MMERILCAAYKIDDLIFNGHRHKDCLMLAAKCIKNATKENSIAGFLTSTNRFVNRKEAYEIAFQANQIIGPNKGCPENEIGLTSEDLY